ISDAGDCLKEIARERVDCLQMSAVDQQRSLMELRKRGNPVLFEVQRHGSWPARRRMSVEHVSDFGKPVVERGRESWKLRHQPLTVELPHFRKTLPPALGRAGQLRKLLDQAPPGVVRLPCFVAIDLRAVEQTTKTREHLRGLSPERLHLRIMRFTDCRREIAGGELTMDGHQPADCVLKDFT